MARQTKRPLLAAFGRNIVLQIVIGIVGMCLVLVCTAALMVWIGFAANLDSDISVIVLVATVVCFSLALVGGSVGIVFLVISQRARRFDALFEPLGLTGSMFALTGRQYRGAVSGRQVHIKFYRGPALTYEVSTSVQTRFAIGTRTGLGQAASGILRSRTIQVDDPDYGHLASSGHDENWARNLLADSTAKAAILRLTRDEVATEIRNLIVQPGKVQLMIYRFRISMLTAENVRMWMDDLLAFADAAEELPAPSDAPET
jgi:hypothetical protein